MEDLELYTLYQRCHTDGRTVEFLGRELIETLLELSGRIMMVRPMTTVSEALDELRLTDDDILDWIEARRELRH